MLDPKDMRPHLTIFDRPLDYTFLGKHYFIKTPFLFAFTSAGLKSNP